MLVGDIAIFVWIYNNYGVTCWVYLKNTLTFKFQNKSFKRVSFAGHYAHCFGILSSTEGLIGFQWQVTGAIVWWWFQEGAQQRVWGPQSWKSEKKKHVCKDARCERDSAESLTAVQFDSDPSQWLHYWYSCGMIITRTFFLKPEACLPNTSVKEEEGGVGGGVTLEKKLTKSETGRRGGQNLIKFNKAERIAQALNSNPAFFLLLQLLPT